jgi:hypothetical protein
MVRRLMFCAVAALLLSGCWPARVTYRPSIMGTVVSAADAKAVVGASAELSVPREDLVPVSSAITTSSDGRFEVKAYYRWGLDSILGERLLARGTVRIAASGFAPYTQELIWSGPRTQELGVIQLVPLR